MSLEIVVSGATGRMGRVLGPMIREAHDMTAVAGIAPVPVDDTDDIGYPVILPLEQATDALSRCHALIDFSAPEHLARLLDQHAETLAGRAVLVGTTGLEHALELRLQQLAEHAAVLLAANFSIGVNLLMGLVERAARALPADHYDVEIVETHHGAKEDAPSGTALALGEAVARGRDQDLHDLRRDGRTGRPGPRPPGEVGFHALRGGAVAGEHDVHFLGERERIRLGHQAAGRELFAEGALRAARWLAGREPGRYTMAEVLGLVDRT